MRQRHSSRPALPAQLFFTLAVLCLSLAAAIAPRAARAEDALLGARFPALSPDGSRIAFSYWGDIWTAPLDGSSGAQRLTDHIAFDSLPRYSPDGEWIAFNSDRGGSLDIWVISASGGEARAVTTFSGAETLCGWTPEGRIIYSSRRGLWADELYVVDPQQGESSGAPLPQQLSRLDHYSAAFGALLPASAPGGGGWVYQRGGGRWWRKGYRGTAQTDLWRIDADGRHSRLTDFKGMDQWPLVSPDGQSVYYVNDSSGIDNIWALSLADGSQRQLTHHSTDGVQWPSLSGDGKTLAYEFEGSLYTIGTAEATPRKLALRLAGEGKGNLVFRDSFSDSADEFTVSPNGRYLVFTHAGDLWAIKDPKAYEDEKLWKDKRKPDQDTSLAWRLTASDKARERQPVFAPDNRHIAYISDAEGDYNVYVMDLADESVKKLSSNPADDCEPQYDPQSSEVLFYYSGNRRIVRHDLKTDKVCGVAEGRFRGGFGYNGFAVSPDGKWVAYVNEENDWSGEIYIVDSEGAKPPVNVTRDPASEGGPAWSADGRRFGFSRDGNVYVLDLNPRENSYDLSLLFEEDKKSPEQKAKDKEAAAAKAKEKGKDLEADKAKQAGAESEQAAGSDTEDGADKDEDTEKKDDKQDEGKDEKQVEVKIDFEDIHLRARVVNQQQNARGLLLSDDGEWAVYEANPDGKGSQIWSAKIEGSDSKKLKDGGWSGERFAAKGKRIYYRESAARERGSRDGGGGLRYLKFSEGSASGTESLPARGELWVSQRERWAQMYREAWRTMREQFYDPTMHGTDWNAVYDKYLPLMQRINTPEEFSYIFSEVLGELNASHLGISMASSSFSGPVHSTCHLGLEFDPAFGGPGLLVRHITYQGPCDQPGVDIKAGDVLLSIEGQALSPDKYWWPLLDDREGKPVVLSLAARPGETEARSVTVKPISYGSYQGLLYREWEKQNEDTVAKLSGGRIGYIHIRGMSQGELAKFTREFRAETFDKDALIVDVRFNPGGFIHEELFNLLDKSPFGIAGHRDAPNVVQPASGFFKPKALLINASSGSDAEIFPTGWRQLALGPVIGIDTAGAVIGTGGFSLVDGTTVRLPLEGWWDIEGRNLEKGGTPPDIYLDVDPNALREGHDAQLEKAVEVLLQELKKGGS